MDREQEKLLMRYFDGGLEGDDAERLDECLQSDESFREEFLQFARQERVMRVLLEDEGDDVLIQRVINQLRAEKDGEAFVNKVQKEITDRHTGVKKKRQPGLPRPRTFRQQKRSSAASPWTLPLSIAAMLILAIGVYFINRKNGSTQAETIATVMALSGSDITAEGGNGLRALQTGSTLSGSDAVRTGSSSKLTLKYADGTTVELGASASLAVNQPNENSAKQLRLERGTLVADVQPQPEGSPFSVTTAQARATVKGTILSVSANTSDTRLEVRRGKVEFERVADHANVTVSEGKFAVAGAVDIAFEARSLVPEGPPLREPKPEDFLAKIFQATSGQKLPYRLFVPTRNDKSQKYPLVIFLHGIGEAGADNSLQFRNNANGAMVFISAKAQAEHPCFMLIPQSASGWWGDYVDTFGQLIQALSKEYNIDPDRVCVTGLSSGGNGCWDLITRQPKLFACAVPISGAGNTGAATAAVNVAVWNFHAADDPIMNIQGSRGMIDALRKAGGHPFYTEYPSGGHESWVRAYKEPGLVDWVMSQKRGHESAPPSPYPFPH